VRPERARTPTDKPVCQDNTGQRPGIGGHTRRPSTAATPVASQDHEAEPGSSYPHPPVDPGDDGSADSLYHARPLDAHTVKALEFRLRALLPEEPRQVKR
jgi:hypothetical protein